MSFTGLVLEKSKQKQKGEENDVKKNEVSSNGNGTVGGDLDAYVTQLAAQGKAAAQELRVMPDAKRKKVLFQLAKELQKSEKAILDANTLDLQLAEQEGMSEAYKDRLLLNPKRIASMAQSVLEIAKLPDPLGRVLKKSRRKDGLALKQVSVPIGTIFFIFESRPNVTIDGGALCFRSGNSVVLRGGKEAAHSNQALADCFTRSLKMLECNPYCIQLVDRSDRLLVDKFLGNPANADLVIPRGGEGLIQAVVTKSRIPVIKHYKGVCHVYIDKSADLKQATAIAINAKTQRPGVCNAMETLLIDEALKSSQIKSICSALRDAGAKLRGEKRIQEIFSDCEAATEADWDEEYLDLRLAVKTVKGVMGAIDHIAKHGTGHTDAVIAKSARVQKLFTEHVDSSSVMVNASTRFADGGEYGLGAEVGISTDKLHARGPMGVESLTSYKWVVQGRGHIRK